jgi:hypothetical protein
MSIINKRYLRCKLTHPGIVKVAMVRPTPNVKMEDENGLFKSEAIIAATLLATDVDFERTGYA